VASTNLSAPPIASIASSSKASSAPVSCSVADQVFPMFTTSGPSPLPTAVINRV
jgi:hypothetical protein